MSVLGLGGGQIGGDDVTDRDAYAVLDAALECGVTFLDSARGYGRSEERIGAYLVGRRDEAVLSTKVGYDVPGEEDWTSRAVTGGIERALRVLRTDVIDVVFLHSCPLEVLRRGEVIDALHTAVAAGKVRVSGYSGENEALMWAATSGLFGALQTSLNLFDQRSLREVVPVAAAAGLGVVAKRPIANAVWRYPDRPTGVYGETYWDRMHAIGLAPSSDTWTATALRFSAYSSGVSTAIVGTTKPDHLRELVDALGRGPLPDEERAAWKVAFDRHGSAWPGEV